MSSELEQGKALAEAGSTAALNSTKMDEWRTEAKTALDLLIDGGENFTADDVTQMVGEPPTPNGMGGLFVWGKGRMKAVGYTQSTRKAGHARIIRVWRAR